MGLRVFVGYFAGTKKWHAVWGGAHAVWGGAVNAVSGTCYRAVSLVGVRVTSHCRLLQSVEPQPNCVHFSEAIGFELPPLPGIKPRSFPKRPIFCEVVGFSVSSARIDGHCRALFDNFVSS